MKEEIIAHAVPNGKGEYCVQPLLEHLLGVGKLAQNYAERLEELFLNMSKIAVPIVLHLVTQHKARLLRSATAYSYEKRCKGSTPPTPKVYRNVLNCIEVYRNVLNCIEVYRNVSYQTKGLLLSVHPFCSIVKVKSVFLFDNLFRGG